MFDWRRGAALGTIVALLLGSATPAAAYVRPGGMERVSVSSGGVQGDDRSTTPSLSADARYVAFQSDAGNLVAGDTNGARDVFVHDRLTGVTERVSVATDGTQGHQESRSPSISPDGRYVAFQSEATNLVPGDTNSSEDVFVHDRTTGATERVSMAADGGEGNDDSGSPSITTDGRIVAFWSAASNLVPGDTDLGEDVFVRDLQTGITERVSVGAGGVEGNEGSSDPVITPDGRYVAFESAASNLVVGDLNETSDVFVRDRGTGTTEIASVPSNGTEREDYSRHPAGGFSSDPEISADGRYVVFYGQATNLVPGDANGSSDVFVRDRQAGVTERVSVAANGAEAGGSWEPSISADGRYVVFTTTAPNLTLANAGPDVVLHDRVTGSSEKIAVAGNGAWGNGLSSEPAISADGRRVVFESHASNLVADDINTVQDLFVRDRGAPVGVSAVATFSHEDGVSVSGRATFSGQVISSAVDAPDDGAPGADPAGAELIGASVIYRPEDEDLLVKLRLASVPSNRQVCLSAAFCEHTGTGAPEVLYGLEFNLAPFRMEVRAARSATTSLAPRFAVYWCTAVCLEEPGASGGIGTTGDEVLISVPLRSLGQPSGGPVSEIRAFTAIGDTDTGALATIDELALPDSAIPRLTVSLGIAPAGTPEGSVAFDTDALINGGAFSGDVDTSSVPPGDHDVWVRACLGQACGASSRSVSLE